MGYCIIPTWNVYIGDFNSRNIETYNIFRHTSFREDYQKILREYRKVWKKEGVFDRDAFAEELRHPLMYYYWSKCEWEIVLQHWPQHESFKDMKIDVYDQVRLNWDVFVDYVWNHREVIIKWK